MDPEICGDGIDNDGDELVDCDDDDCVAYASCIPVCDTYTYSYTGPFYGEMFDGNTEPLYVPLTVTRNLKITDVNVSIGISA